MGAQGLTADIPPKSYFVHKAGIPLRKNSVCMVLNDDGKVTDVCIFLLGFGSLLC